ncbi:MAG: flagellar biosynthetic protein FliO [Actinomycetota bacterium]|nr:flagellar biosynthetic protein FliO [Actinomycetota bacterium]
MASASLLALIKVQVAFAANGEQTPLDLEEAGKTAQAGNGGGAPVLRTILALIVVVGLIYGITWLLKWVKRSQEEKVSGSGLQSLATLPLGPNRSLHLVRVGEEVVLLGVGEGGVTPIRTYHEAEAVSLGLYELTGQAGSASLSAPVGHAALIDGNPVPVRQLAAATAGRAAVPAASLRGLSGSVEGDGNEINARGLAGMLEEIRRRTVIK